MSKTMFVFSILNLSGRESLEIAVIQQNKPLILFLVYRMIILKCYVCYVTVYTPQTNEYQSVTEHPRAGVNFQSVPTSSAE